MTTLRVWIAAVALLAIGLANGVSSVSAQEALGEIEIATYFCESAERAGEVDFFVGAVVAGEEGDCALAAFDAVGFTLYDAEDNEIDSTLTDGVGFASFLGVAAGSYYVAEVDTGAVTDLFDVTAGGYVSITYVGYFAEVVTPDPTEFGSGSIQVEHKTCTSGERAGETDIFAGAAVSPSDESFACTLVEGTSFTVEPIVIENDVEAAGANGFNFTTDEFGLTPVEEIEAGDHHVSKTSDSSVAVDVNVPNAAYVLVSVIDYVAPDEDAATLTIHKSECETGVGSVIFEECHDDAVEDVTFWVNEAEWTTDEDGVAAGEIAPGNVEIAEDEADFDDYLGAYVYCSEQGSGDVLFDSDSQDGVIEIAASGGDEIVCDWYNITAASTTPDDDDDDDKTPTTLPNTGTGAMESASTGSAYLLLGMLSLLAAAGVFTVHTRRG